MIFDLLKNRVPAWACAVPAALLAACSPVGAAQDTPAAPQAQSAPEKHPTSGLQLIDVTVVSANGAITFKTEHANTPQAQARGMMFRTEMADDEAMLFPSDVPAVRSFWMKNTPISLDIIFIGVDGRINNIETAVPYSLDSVTSVGPASAVLEIRGGLAEELGIVAGNKVEYTLP
ncbi:MAG: DUF192 domain-containing protein [Erythrobacter sp.]